MLDNILPIRMKLLAYIAVILHELKMYSQCYKIEKKAKKI